MFSRPLNDLVGSIPTKVHPSSISAGPLTRRLRLRQQNRRFTERNPKRGGGSKQIEVKFRAEEESDSICWRMNYRACFEVQFPPLKRCRPTRPRWRWHLVAKNRTGFVALWRVHLLGLPRCRMANFRGNPDSQTNRGGYRRRRRQPKCRIPNQPLFQFPVCLILPSHNLSATFCLN